MKLASVGVLGVLVVLLNGCSSVYCTAPLGERPLALVAEEWDGLWLAGDGSMTLQVVPDEPGLLRLAWVEKGEQGVKLETYLVRLRESGPWVFATVDDKDDAGRHLWGRLKKDGNEILAWVPNVEGFRALVRDGKLPGQVDDDGDVTLGELTAEQLVLITSGGGPPLVNWEDPLVLIRLQR